MFTITKLKMWKDPKYTRQCLEVPPPGSWKLPAPDYTSSEDLRPRRGSTLSQIELPLSYIEVFDMSYLYIEAKDSATPTPHTISVFGWILSIEEIASSNDVVRITWTPDYWRTYAGSVTFGRGIVTKSSNSTYKRPLRINPRRYNYDSEIILSADQTVSEMNYHRCILFTYVTSNGSLKLGITAPKMHDSVNNQDWQGLTIAEADDLPTKLNIPSASIKGCWICPYPPLSFSSWTTGDSELRITGVVDWKHYGARTWIEMSEVYSNLNTLNYPVDVETDETTYYTVCDGYGTPFLTTPYGINVKRVHVALDVGATEAYITVALSITSDYSPSLIGTQYQNRFINMGLMVNIPLPAVSITSSSLSDYYASGQRDFDINNRRIAQEKQFWSGLAGVGGSAIGGGIAGGMTKAGGGIGAVAGAGVGLAGVGIDFLVTGKTDDDLQSATDQLYANQAGTLITIGNTGRNMLSTGPIRLVKMVADSVSAGEIGDYISTQGYDVEIPTSSVSGFIPSSGPIQVKNLQITGSVPPLAKDAIKNKLENGVYVVENNPSGVVP